MKIYFLSSQPCALTVNGAYFGLTDGFERFAEVSLKDKLFIQFTPENALPLGFFLTEQIRFSPPEGCEVYLLNDGIALYARDFPPADYTLRPVTQKRQGDLLVTVYVQGRVQASFESPQGFFVSTLPPSFASCELSFENGLVFLRSPDMLAVYTAKGERAFCERVLSHEITNGELSVVLPLSDSLGRTARCTYALDETGVTRMAFSLAQSRTANGDFETEKLRDDLLPYAFFESVLIGANYAEMLSDELAPKASEILSFLGDFTAVMPTRRPNVCALIRKKRERLFEAAYFTVETKDGKIVDVKG